MMQTGQILWGLNSFLFIICFFFVRIWINSLGKTMDKMEMRLNLKLDAIVCVERHNGMKDACTSMAKHKHAPVTKNGLGGEVIIS